MSWIEDNKKIMAAYHYVEDWATHRAIAASGSEEEKVAGLLKYKEACALIGQEFKERYARLRFYTTTQEEYVAGYIAESLKDTICEHCQKENSDGVCDCTKAVERYEARSCASCKMDYTQNFGPEKPCVSCHPQYVVDWTRSLREWEAAEEADRIEHMCNDRLCY